MAVRFEGPLFRLNRFDQKKVKRKTLNDIEKDFEKEMKKIYRSNNWPPNAPAYLAAGKPKGGEGTAPGRKPGIRTGKLMRSLTQGGPGAIRKKTSNSIELGTSIDYYKHQTERDPLKAIDETVRARWSRMLGENFMDELNRV